MNEQKKLKAYYGRVNRILRIPVDVHQAIKNVAKKQSLTVSEMYDRIVVHFLNEIKNSESPVPYRYHQGNAKKTSVYLKEETLNEVKSLVIRDSAPENRIIFTAIMRFVDENLLLTV